jgi:hypothetical protein
MAPIPMFALNVLSSWGKKVLVVLIENYGDPDYECNFQT